MPTIIPGSQPRLSASQLSDKLSGHPIDRTKYPLIVVGIRGYYSNMGLPHVNDRGLYDDAIFIDTPSATIAFNGNTDPSRRKPGHGRAEATKGMACLNPGLYYAHRYGLYKGQPALRQDAGEVLVTRDGTPNYQDRGWFGIHIHKGGTTRTSSLGCQTIPPEQWLSFISSIRDQAQRYYGAVWRQKTIPYALLIET
jgi:lysozyme